MREKPPILVQESSDSKEVPSHELANKFKHVRPFDRVLRLPDVLVPEKQKVKRWLGLIGTKEVTTYTAQKQTIEVWSIYPQDVLQTDDLYCRYLSENGRVFDRDIDFGVSELVFYDVDAAVYDM